MDIKYNVSKLNNSKLEEIKDSVSVEEPLEMRLRYKKNDEWKIENISITMRTPGNDKDLIKGFLFNERIIKNINDIKSIEHQGEASGDYNLQSGGNGRNNKLVSVDFGATALAIPNMQGATTLETFSQTYSRGGTTNPLVSGSTYLFENCSSLTSLNFYATNLGEINFPTNGFTNNSLQRLDLRLTNIKGGVSGDENEVIKANTFASCPNIEEIYIDSGNLLAEEINFDAFKLNPALNFTLDITIS